MKDRLLVFAVAFPVILMAGWLCKLVWERASGVEVELSIVGYDPRDLWSGHYLRYSVDYGPIKICASEHLNRQVCVCLSQPASGELARALSVETCDSVACPVFLRGNCDFDRFEANIERLYFPESYAEKLQVVPPKSTIKISVSPTGSALVKALYIDGQTLPEWIAANSADNSGGD